nr:hypothetical protein [Tanacetum cinerariifolium]
SLIELQMVEQARLVLFDDGLDVLAPGQAGAAVAVRLGGRGGHRWPGPGEVHKLPALGRRELGEGPAQQRYHGPKCVFGQAAQPGIEQIEQLAVVDEHEARAAQKALNPGRS